MSNIGVPIKLLHEAEGMKVTVEMKNGEIYRGLLLSSEDTMNMSLSEVLRTARTGQITKLPNVYLRGSSVRFIALPDLLKNASGVSKGDSNEAKDGTSAAATAASWRAKAKTRGLIGLPSLPGCDLKVGTGTTVSNKLLVWKTLSCEESMMLS